MQTNSANQDHLFSPRKKNNACGKESRNKKHINLKATLRKYNSHEKLDAKARSSQIIVLQLCLLHIRIEQ